MCVCECVSECVFVRDGGDGGYGKRIRKEEVEDYQTTIDCSRMRKSELVVLRTLKCRQTDRQTGRQTDR